MCVHGDWRADAAPPFEPPGSRAAAGAPGAPGAQPPDPRSGARLAQRRTGVACHPRSRRQTSSPPPRRRPSGSPTSGSGPTRSSAASLSASMPPSASRSPRRPVMSPAAASTRRRRAVCLPAGTNRAAGRGLGATPSAAKGAATAALFRALRPDQGGGSLPAPLPAQTRGLDSQACGRTATGTPAFEHDAVRGKRQKHRQKGGAVLLPLKPDPESCATGDKSPPGSHSHEASGLRRLDARRRLVSPGAGGRCGRAPRPGARSPVRWSSSLRRARPAFDGAIPSRRCIPPMRLGVPEPTDRCSRKCSRFPPLPPLYRDCRPTLDVLSEVMSAVGDHV